MRHFVTYSYDRRFRLFDDVLLTFTNSGHMLGGAICSLEIYETDRFADRVQTANDDGSASPDRRWKRLAYTGDIGRKHCHILPSPQLFPQCDYLICESTYGDRLHEEQEVTEEQLLGVVEDTCVYRKGQLLIPSFSVGRTQEIVYVLNQLYNDGRLPHIPVYVDSPMSTNATQIFRMYPEELSEEVHDTLRFDSDPFGFNTLRYITDIRESKALNHKDEPCIIISASGMLLYHHLRFGYVGSRAHQTPRGEPHLRSALHDSYCRLLRTYHTWRTYSAARTPMDIHLWSRPQDQSADHEDRRLLGAWRLPGDD